MGTEVMGHVSNVACPLLDPHGGRIMWHMDNRAHEQWDTWALGHMSTRGSVIGHMGDGEQG